MKNLRCLALLVIAWAANELADGQTVYPYFSPGGALSGPGFSQNVNLSAGAPFIAGTLPVSRGGTGGITVTGPLKGNGTAAYSAATSADILALWSGTCNATTFLRGDGACAVAGSGSVTSVDLTAPSVFAVTGNPVTTSGTLALAFATGQTQNRVLASPNGSSGAVSLRALVGADIPAINLAGTGNGGIVGNLPVANLNSGTAASASTFWRGDGSWATPASAGSVTSVALTAPAIFTITGSPVTTSGTLGLVAAGTSGGIPYFDTASTLASSSALTNHALVVGGGAGAPPTVVASLGTASTVLHGAAAGNPTFGAVALATEVSGNLPVTNLDSGTGATATTYWSGAGSWTTPAGAGGGGVRIGLGSTSSRTSTSTPTCDSTLTTTIAHGASPKSYSYEAFIEFLPSAITAIGGQWDRGPSIAGTGNSFKAWQVVYSNQTTIAAAAPLMINDESGATGAGAAFPSTSRGLSAQVIGTILVGTTNDAVVCVGWAQFLSSATPTVMQAGSYLSVQPQT